MNAKRICSASKLLICETCKCAFLTADPAFILSGSSAASVGETGMMKREKRDRNLRGYAQIWKFLENQIEFAFAAAARAFDWRKGRTGLHRDWLNMM